MNPKCAYKLKLDCFNDLREDLNNINNRLNSGESIPYVKNPKYKNYSGAYFVSNDALLTCNYNTIAKLNKVFNNSLLNVTRIHNLYPGETYPWHRDGREGLNGVYGEEWGEPTYRVISAGISILLSDFNDDITEYGITTGLQRDNQKFINNNHEKYEIKYNNEDDIKMIDSISVPDTHAVLSYIGLHHKVVTTKQVPRVIAIIPFWPNIQFEEVVDYCRSNNILIERG